MGWKITWMTALAEISTGEGERFALLWAISSPFRLGGSNFRRKVGPVLTGDNRPDGRRSL